MLLYRMMKKIHRAADSIRGQLYPADAIGGSEVFMNWDLPDIADAVMDRLKRQCKKDDTAQAVYSLDSSDELDLHPHIQNGLLAAGYGVWPEQRYPTEAKKKKKSEGRRCDIVLTPDNRPLANPENDATLFAPENTCGLEEAFWLEIKTVSQFTIEGPFPRYSAELLQPVSKDLKKLSSDPMIHHAGLMIVLFTESKKVAVHDLGVWEEKCMEKAIPIGVPILRHHKIRNRLGNGMMTVGLYGLSRLGQG